MKTLLIVLGLASACFGIRHLAIRAMQWIDETIGEPDENPDDAYTIQRMNKINDDDTVIF